jgi:hypothetical protein
MFAARALLALAIIAAPKQTALVRTTVDNLPVCVQRALAPQLRGVAVTLDDALGAAYDGVATPDGLIIVTITPADSLQVELLHELGYEVDYHIDAVTPELRRAVRHDFAALSAQERHRLRYFSSPTEAFAEFFAERYDPGYSAEGVPDLDRLVRTRRVVNGELDRLERCAR